MPIVEVRGQRIHYSVAGSGPLLVCQHGFFDIGTSWYSFGWVDALADRFTVAVIDSIGHGHSDKPVDADSYKRPTRAAHVAAVADEIGSECFHFVGYSMGGWIGSAVAEHCPERLSSLVIGGWGVHTGMPVVMSFSQFLEGARELAPQLVDWVTPEVEPALDTCLDALYDLGDSASAVAALDCPTLLWDGTEDVHYAPAKSWAATEGIEFLSVTGGHLDAMQDVTGESRDGVLEFLGRTLTA